MPSRIFYDSFNGNQLRHVEDRPDGNALYDDLKTGDRIVCNPLDVAQYPRARFYAPIMVKHFEPTPEQLEEWSRPGTITHFDDPHLYVGTDKGLFKL